MEFRDHQAIYVQIADYVCEQVLLGQWPADEKIPSVRDLGVLLQVNPNTVMRSYEWLQQRDVIYNKRGIGFFVSPQARAHILEYRREVFLEQELPVVLRNLILYDIPLEELTRRYDACRRDLSPPPQP
ncbi:MAG: GntR family transcriptional regulator [Saprospiraceae bacterium]|nr:GntR family transcriptional regulator [Saprospiraceae bacterium]